MKPNLDQFTRAYIECALWSSNDESAPSGGNPLDQNYSADDIAPPTLARMAEDCAGFQAANAAHLADYPAPNAGHDFWLTRNGHGCGYWENDFSTPEHCTALDIAARATGSADLYVGDDGKIYQMGAES